MNTESDKIREMIREGYGAIAASGGSCCSAKPTCCGSSPAAADELGKHIGYSAAELASLPEGANMGLSCGNPNALAALQPGEVVLDLGAGGGFDVFYIVSLEVQARKPGNAVLSSQAGNAAEDIFSPTHP